MKRPEQTAAATGGGAQSGHRRLRLPSIAVYVGLIFGIGALVLVGVAVYTALKVENINSLAHESERRAAEDDIDQAVLTLVADSRSILREVALWDETRKQLDNPVYYQFWWRNRLMNPARIPHYVQSMEVYTADRRSLSWAKETPLPEALPEAESYVAWDGYGNSLFNFVPILDQRGQWPPIGYLGIRMSLSLALPELYQFRYLQPDTLEFDLPADQKIAVNHAHRHADYQLPATSEILPLVEAVNHGTSHLIVVNMVLLFLGVWLARMLLVHPLLRMERFVQDLRKRPHVLGNNRALRFRVRELQNLHNTLHDYDSELSQLHRDLDAKNAELWRMAHIDALTGVRNRRAFEERWQQIAESDLGCGKIVSFLMFDCDQLKSINDTHGHDTGDQALRSIATLVKDRMDDSASLYRLGGDEFATVLVGMEPEAAESLARACLAAVEGFEFRELGLDEPLCISIGLASGRPTDIEALKTLSRQADAAMYRSKRPTGPKLSVHER